MEISKIGETKQNFENFSEVSKLKNNDIENFKIEKKTILQY